MSPGRVDGSVTDAIERAVLSALPARRVEDVEEYGARPGNRTARVTFADAPGVFVKTATDTADRLRRETAATRYAGAHCSLRVPEVVAAAPDGDPPYLVTEPLPGTALNDPWTDLRGDDWRDDGSAEADDESADEDGADDGALDRDTRRERERLFRQVGRALAAVHEARFDRPGVIQGGDADGLDLAGGSWTATLCATVEFRVGDWLPDRFEDLPGRLVEVVRAVDPTVERPVLCHGDLSRKNLHLDPLGALDWERAVVGDPAFDLVDATEHHAGQPDVPEDDRPDLRAAIEGGYEAVAGDLPAGLERRRPLYRAMWHLLVLQAFEDWSADVDRPADDLAAEVREEFDQRLDAAREAA